MPYKLFEILLNKHCFGMLVFPSEVIKIKAYQVKLTLKYESLLFNISYTIIICPFTFAIEKLCYAFIILDTMVTL